ncbi:aminotransferase class IV family protein [Arcobacter sp. 15-2]|uniref:aminotransferase class IV n=1 Tax=Arcobacter sp. 15-2 TaxID=3374109 RepID=UPI00399C6AFA
MNYFETIKCEDNEILNLPYHEKRIAKTIGKNFNLREYIYPISDELLRCKVIYNEDEIIDITYTPYSKKSIKTFQIVCDNDIQYNSKYLDRKRIDKLVEKRQNADEIIIVKNGLVTDTSIANIAVYLDDQWYTPKKPLLLGTTRLRYLDRNIIKELDITIKELLKAKKIALLNAMVDFDIIEDFKFLV